MRQYWSRKVLVNHLFTQTSRQNLVSSRFFLSGSCFPSFQFSYCVYFYFACLCGVTNGAGTADPSGAPAFTISFQWGSCYSIFSVICICFVNRCLSFCTFFLLASVLSVLHRYTILINLQSLLRIMYYLQSIYFTLSHGIIKSIYSNDWVVHFY